MPKPRAAQSIVDTHTSISPQLLASSVPCVLREATQTNDPRNTPRTYVQQSPEQESVRKTFVITHKISITTDVSYIGASICADGRSDVLCGMFYQGATSTTVV